MSLAGKKLVLFDGVCNVCNALVLFIIDRDRREKFVFAPLSSELGQRITKEHGLDGPNMDSMVLVEEDGRAYSHSTGALRVLAQLGGLWTIFWAGLILPRALRDAIYRWFARHRYGWFGKSDQCRVPTPELRRRFVA